MTALSTVSLADEVATLLADLGVERQRFTGGKLAARTPISGETVPFMRRRRKPLTRQLKLPMTPF